MQDKLKSEWAALVQEGIKGQAVRFRLRAGRLAQLIQRSDPDLAAVLFAGLASESQDLARDATITRIEEPRSLAAAGLLSIEQPTPLELEPVWTSAVSIQLSRLTHEWRHADELRAAGLTPVRSVLLQGPPGVGKSLAARWLSSELGLPLATLDLAAVINSYLGKTGQNVSQVLEFARKQPCILFLDEFDALAKRRDDNQDVGELKRVVNVLLQAIDQWRAPSLLVAATNHPQLLDSAMFRRFDQVIEFPAVTATQAMNALLTLGVPEPLARSLGREMPGQPLSEVYRRVLAARKLSVLQGVQLNDALRSVWAAERPARSQVERRRNAVAQLADAGKSTRAIAKALDVSHTTVVRDLRALGIEAQHAE
jgi:hypothetical protein